MIRINKLILLFLFNVTFIFAQDKLSPLGMELKSSEERISTLVNTIEDNLSGTSVLELFRNEQKIWQEYLNSRIETLFPHYVNGVKMQWGSILSHELARITLQMNLERIKILEDFLYVKNETGTDGKGEFKEDFWAITLSFPTTAETPVVAPAEAKVVVAPAPPASRRQGERPRNRRNAAVGVACHRRRRSCGGGRRVRGTAETIAPSQGKRVGVAEATAGAFVYDPAVSSKLISVRTIRLLFDKPQ